MDPMPRLRPVWRLAPKHWKHGAPLLVPNYIETYLAPGEKTVAPQTFAHYKSRLRRHVAPFWPRRDIRSIRYGHLMAPYNHLLDGMHKNSAGCVMDFLRHLFGFAHRSEDIRSIPPWPSCARERRAIEFLTFEQQEEIFGTIPDDDQPIFRFMAEFGLRTGEAIALQRDCVRDGMIHVWRTVSGPDVLDRPKARFRSMPMTEYGRAILDGLPLVASPFIFVNRRSNLSGMRYSHKALYRIWKNAQRDSGYRIQLKNACRHSLGCQLLNEGVDIDAVRQIYGHTSYEMVRRYAERSSETLKSILESRRGQKIVPFGKRSGK